MVSIGPDRAVRRRPSGRVLRIALGVGVAVPFLYFGTQLAVGLATPGYSFARQAASELGAVGAAHAAWFNAGALLTGAGALIAAVALGSVAVRAHSRRVLTGLTAVAVASIGLGAAAAGVFPLPDHRHGGGPAGAGAFVLPVLAAVLLWPRTEPDPVLRTLPGVRWYLVANLVLFVAGAAVTSGAAGVDLTGRHGLVQRLLAITVFVPVAVISLAARPPREEPAG